MPAATSPAPEARLHASYKGSGFAALQREYRGRTGPEGTIVARRIARLGTYFHGLREHIERRAPCVRLAAAGAQPVDAATYARTYAETIGPADDQLQTLMHAFVGGHPVGAASAPGDEGDEERDRSALMLFDPNRLIGTEILDAGEPVHGFAFYFDPASCRRLVFFGAGTLEQAAVLAGQAAAPDFDWAAYSRSYARWRQ